LKRPKVFVSYSHGDRQALKQFQPFLQPLEQDGLVNSWDDTRLQGGDDWPTEIDQALLRQKAQSWCLICKGNPSNLIGALLLRAFPATLRGIICYFSYPMVATL
jgi:hypothetical protein